MLSYSEFPFALFLTQPIQSQTTPVIIASVAVSPNACLSLTSVTPAMTVPNAFALIVRRYLLHGPSRSRPPTRPTPPALSTWPSRSIAAWRRSRIRSPSSPRTPSSPIRSPGGAKR
jgi:hypothetical protein